MSKTRDSFIFYRSFYEAITEFPEENQLEIYRAISEFSLNQKEPSLTGISKTIWILIRPQLEANNKKFINGIKPKTKSKLEAKDKQEVSKTEGNVNANVNENKNVNVNDNKQEIFNKWLDYRKQIKKAIKVKLTLNSLVEKINTEPLDKVQWVINSSIENGYQGLFWDNYEQRKNKEKSSGKKEIKSDIQEAIDQAERLYGNNIEHNE